MYQVACRVGNKWIDNVVVSANSKLHACHQAGMNPARMAEGRIKVTMLKKRKKKNDA